MVKRHGLDAKRHFTGAGCFRLRKIDDFELAVFDELQCAHWSFLALKAFISR